MIWATEIISFALLDTIIANRYVECGEVFAKIPHGGPESIVLLWALVELEKHSRHVGVLYLFLIR
jgi:hypothetical protein